MGSNPGQLCKVVSEERKGRFSCRTDSSHLGAAKTEQPVARVLESLAMECEGAMWSLPPSWVSSATYPGFSRRDANPSITKPQQLYLLIQESKSRAEHGLQMDLRRRSEFNRDLGLQCCWGGCLGEELAEERGLEVGSACHLLESFLTAGQQLGRSSAGALRQTPSPWLTISRMPLVPGAVFPPG